MNHDKEKIEKALLRHVKIYRDKYLAREVIYFEPICSLDKGDDFLIIKCWLEDKKAESLGEPLDDARKIMYMKSYSDGDSYVCSYGYAFGSEGYTAIYEWAKGKGKDIW